MTNANAVEFKNAVDILLDDHKRIREGFDAIRDAADPARRLAAVKEALWRLSMHSILEEEIFYPAFSRRAEEAEVADEATEEHRIIDRLIYDLGKADPAMRTYDAKLAVLIETVKRHIEFEEARLFPVATELKMTSQRLYKALLKKRKELIEWRDWPDGRHGNRIGDLLAEPVPAAPVSEGARTAVESQPNSSVYKKESKK